MKVTDEMVDKLAEGLDLADMDTRWLEPRPILRRILESVLADVPDPYETTSELVNAHRHIAELEAHNAELQKTVADPDLIRLCKANAEVGMMHVNLQCRVHQLDDKLSRVHSWASFFTPGSVGEAELWAILDDVEES